jgi:hypothetical protein
MIASCGVPAAALISFQWDKMMIQNDLSGIKLNEKGRLFGLAAGPGELPEGDLHGQG